MTIKFAKATASDEGRSAVFAGNETRAAAEAYTARWFFRKRTLCIVGLVAGFLAINALSGAYVDFDFMEAAADIPGGLAWMAVNFLPSAASLEKLPQIMPALLSTVLDSIAASTTAALLAYVVAVLGSRSVGLGGVAQVLARGIASLFRNIPVVAWAFILLFSFHQSEFTGFLALFLGSFGYLTRCFLESIDEISSGTIEALRATGAHFTLPDLVDGLFVSLALATLTTVLGAVIAFVLGLCAAMNLSNRVASNAIKAVMSLFRAVPTILWVLIFTVAIGLGPEAAVAGLLFHGIAYLTKAYSESFEEVDPGVVEALRASGASWWQVVFSAVVPEKLSEILSWTFIRFEINFVNVVAVGAVAGAGGIGYQLFLAGSFYYDIHEVGLIVYFCFAVAVALELLSTQLRKRLIVQN